MAIPEEIRRVPRPKNTIVIANRVDGPKKYAVRERKSVKYVPGGNPQPVNGKVIGHIINNQYVPIQEATASKGPDSLSYGASALAKSVSHDLLEELLAVYPAPDACAIMALATLRAIKPGIASNRVATHYSRTFVCRDYPGLAMSKNSIAGLLQRLGEDGEKRREFYKRRIDKVVSDHHVAIDGTLKQDTSRVNDLSAFSYKAKGKKHREVSVLYAYDIENMEPLCAEVYPGNHNNDICFESFVRNNDIRKGILISDRGFSVSRVKALREERPDLHFLTPLKRNDTRIRNNMMLSFEGVLQGVGDHVVYKKTQIKGDTFLYAFKSAKVAADEEKTYLARAESKKNFNPAKYAEKQKQFGTIVFESDADLPPKVIYSCYDDRWLLELVFARYKDDECLDKTNVQGDFSVLGSELVNFIATVITCRIVRKARDLKLLDKVSYGELMEDLRSAWRMVDTPAEVHNETPRSDDGQWVHTLPMVFEELEALNLSIPTEESKPKKPGRPRKNPDAPVVKRKPGRPKKNVTPVPSADAISPEAATPGDPA